MSKKSDMKIVVSRDEVELVLKRASLAAMTEEGQSEMARASNETRGCVRIVAKDGVVTFDSGVSRFSSRHVVKAADGVASIEVEGEACVPAKEFKDVVSKIPSECRVAMSYAFQPPAPDPSTPESIKSLMPDGVLSVGTLRKDRIIVSVRIESYPTDHFAKVDYPSSGLKVVASGKAKMIKEMCGAIAFAINPKDVNEVLNKYAMFDGGDKIYFVGTDSRRCAILNAEKSRFSGSSDFAEEQNGRPIPVLVDAEYLDPILSSVQEDEEVTISVDGKGEYIYLTCGSSSYRISRLDKTMAAKYPDYRRMLSMPIGTTLVADRVECKIILDNVSSANNDRAKYAFGKSSPVIGVHGRGLAVIKDAKGDIAYAIAADGNPLKSEVVCLHTGYFREALKQMKADNIKISFSTDEMKVRVEDETDPKFTYFMQVMNPNEAA